MKVFLSWSGEKSRSVANVFRDWLPRVLQQVEVWLRAADVDSGSHLARSLEQSLGASDAAIVFVTRSNLQSAWLAHEIGALEQILGKPRVIPVAVDLPLAELSGPFSKFQTMPLETAAISRIVQAIQLTDGTFAPIIPSAEQLQDLMRSISVALQPTQTIGTDYVGAGGIAQIGAIGDTATVQVFDRSDDFDRLSARLEHLVFMVEQLNDRVVTNKTPNPTLEPELNSRTRLTLFIGSSIEGKKIAEAIALELEYEVECTLWTQGVFAPGTGTLETLVDLADRYEFSVIVMTADDILIKRGIEHRAPRDNLIFEIGLFTGRLGRGRAFIVHPRDEAIEFPSDLHGTTLINFQMERSDANLQAAVGPACTRIKRAMGI